MTIIKLRGTHKRQYNFISELRILTEKDLRLRKVYIKLTMNSLSFRKKFIKIKKYEDKISQLSLSMKFILNQQILFQK